MTEHGRVPLYISARDCGHDDPPEPDAPVEDRAAWQAWEDWHDGHQPGLDGELVCILTPDGYGCPACTADPARDLPEGEWIECAVADQGGLRDG